MHRSLWQHQADALNACVTALGNRPGYVQMPTGSGKSTVLRRVCGAWIQQAPRHKTIIAVPNRILAFQLRRDFIDFDACERPTLLMQGFRFSRSSKIVIATYSSLSILSQSFLWANLAAKTTLFIADECHHINNNATVNAGMVTYFRNRMGFSASPWTEGCAERFGSNLLYFLSLTDAQKADALCPYEVELCARLDVAKTRRYQLYFVRDGKRFAELGLNSSVFFDERAEGARIYDNREVIDRFRLGFIPCVYANRMLLEGFDCPECKTIYIEKETESLVMAYQMAGRGFRKYGSSACSVYVDNSTAHGALLQAIARAQSA